MRFSSVVTFLVLFLFGVMPVPALADTYEINFTTTTGVAPTSGSFTFNGSAFSNFIVNWNGTIVDLTSEANGPGLNTSGSSCSSASSTPAYGFAIMTQTAVCAGASSVRYIWTAMFEPTLMQPDSNNFSFNIEATVMGGTAPDDIFTDGLVCVASSCQTNAESFGGWTVTDLTTTPTPEPASLPLLLVGTVSLGVITTRKTMLRSFSRRS